MSHLSSADLRKLSSKEFSKLLEDQFLKSFWEDQFFPMDIKKKESK